MGVLGCGIQLSTARPRIPAFEFTGALPTGATLTRASAGTRWTAAGVLATEAANVARFDHDPVSRAPLGLLIEAATTNRIPWSERFEQFDGPNSCTVTPNVATAADGAVAMDRLVPTPNALVAAYVADTTSAKTAATLYTLSVFARAETLRWLAVSGDLFANQRLAWFDLLTGNPGTVGGNLAGATITALGSGLWRVAISFTGTASPYNVFAPQTADGATNGTFAAGSTLAVWGAMLEAGAAPSSYVATAGAAASRAADVLTLDWASRGVADGAVTVRYTFDNGASQDVATTVSGGTAIVPVTLNRRWLRRAALI